MTGPAAAGPRLLVVGLDGADFAVLLPYVEQGRLPNLARLMARGAQGPLRSTYPAMSPPAWTSFMTGKNPGKHGVFDFTMRKDASYDVEFVNARFRRAATIWKLMSDAGKRVCALSVPITFPPEKVNGVQISGIDTPGVGGVADPSAMFPPELHAELAEKLGGYLISPNLRNLQGRPVEEHVEAAFKTIDRKMATAQYLFEREPWDCFMVTLGETDGLAHVLWKYHDRTCPLADETTRAYTGPSPLQQIYERIDAHLGTLLAAAPPDTWVVVMSDHGHQGNGDKAIYLNRWLAQNGVLTYAGGTSRNLVARVLGLAKKAGTANLIPGRYRKALFRKTGLAGKVESYLRFARLDWGKTRAYSEETPYYPNIWINVRGREPQGTVEPGADYEAMRDAIIRDLSAWKDPESGRPIVRAVHRREQLYPGPFLEKCPDLIVEWNLDGDYSYLFKASDPADAKRPAVLRLSGADRAKAKSGDHRDDGILIAAGPHVVQGRLEGARILDLAPTFLHLLGLPVPADMDGDVLTRLFDADFFNANPVRRSGESTESTADAGPGAPGEYTEEEAEAVRRRLQGLGYLE